MISLDLDQVNQYLDQAVAEKGADYVYKSPDDQGNVVEGECLYVHRRADGVAEPGCIVGNVLHRAGLGLWHMRNFESIDALGMLEGMTERDEVTGTERPRVQCSDEVKVMLGNVQSFQDMGTPWGLAVSYARRHFQRAMEAWTAAQSPDSVASRSMWLLDIPGEDSDEVTD